MIFSNFYNFFAIFFGIFYYATGRNEMERKFLFSPFLGLFQLTLDWNEAIMVFFNFLDLFLIFLQFSITRRVGTKRNDNFYSLSFSSFSNLFWLEMKPQRYFLIFLIFLIFLLFFWNFLLRVGLEPNGTITLIFLLSHPFSKYFGLKWIFNDIF